MRHHTRRGKSGGPNHDRGRGHGWARCHEYGQERNSFPGVNHSSCTNHHQKENRKDENCETTRQVIFDVVEEVIMHVIVVLLYTWLSFINNRYRRKKDPEANFVSENQVDITHLDVADFFAHPQRKIDHLIDDGFVAMDE
ncbi:hypothetical protein KY290_033716 [Solanum tuberosum]|uniref:Uncharacterized protein n=1 Tax=Solanum tuberosum TaxID=4113 RepID=A0ABQ7U2X5_SOLTU|nr:hypothetical protein KY290_033716 [Solanum tuberosum]